ncbi:MAG: HAMP domain-containing histidine kinase [Ruminococcus sp.]|nr:HAMP domain-containing histidine kinase [Ruminococcus sp.]
MKLLDSVKALYEKSDDKVIVTDKNLMTIWKNDELLPECIALTDFVCDFIKRPELPIEHEMILHYIDGRAVKVKPLYDSNEIEGYMLTFFDADTIQTLTDRSLLLSHKRNSLGNIRLACSPLVAQLDLIRTGNADAKSIYATIDTSVLKILSTTANSNELSRYYSDEFPNELLNISECLEDTVTLCKKRIEAAGCEFVTDIEPLVFMYTNEDRLSLAVMNLLANGLMYNDAEQKRLEIKLHQENDDIILEVSDNGQAADVEMLREATKPYRPFTRYRMGEMLGLAVVNKFAERFDGKVDFIKSDDGLTVRLTLKNNLPDGNIDFKLKKKPKIIGEYEPIYCILSKGFDFDKLI